MCSDNNCNHVNIVLPKKKKARIPWVKRIPELLEIIKDRRYKLNESKEELKSGLEDFGYLYKLKLICPQGHECDKTSVNDFTGKHKNGCKICAGNQPWSKRIPELKKIIKDRGYELNESEDELKSGLKKDKQKYKLKLICSEGHECNSISIDGFTGKKTQYGCSVCIGQIPWSERIPELLEIIKDRGYKLNESEDELKSGIKKNKYKLKLICPEGHQCNTLTINGFTCKTTHYGCSVCANKQPWSERIPELLEIIKERGYKLNESEDELKSGLEEFAISYKLKLICPEGHESYRTNVDRFTGKQQQGCPTCSTGKSEKMMVEIIEELYGKNAGYKGKHSFIKNITGFNLELDYFIEHQRLAFEYNGGQHYEYIPKHFHRNGYDVFTEQQEKDKLKRKLCEENGITLISIDGREYDHTDRDAMKSHIYEQLDKHYGLD